MKTVFKNKKEINLPKSHILYNELEIQNTDLDFVFQIYPHENNFILQVDCGNDLGSEAFFIKGNREYVIQQFEIIKNSIERLISNLNGDCIDIIYN